MTTLQKGDNAPQFSALDEKGNTIQLKDYRKKKLVLFFYPKASTPGCTAEACDLRDNYNLFLEKAPTKFHHKKQLAFSLTCR
jgi:peroxiredoxin Q/BCP